MKKELKLFTEQRADASGLVSVYPDERGCLLVRRTLGGGWLAYQHDATEQSLGFVTLDAVRLEPEGPWLDWVVLIEGQEIPPIEFEVEDRTPVSGGPESEALRIMAHFGPFAVAALPDQVVLLSHKSSSVLTGPLDEWRPEGVNFEVPASVLPVLALGPDEFECMMAETLFTKAGPLRVMETTRAYSDTKTAEGAATFATIEGPRVEDLPKDLKRALKKHEVRASSGPGSMVKYSTEIAPGWVFATFREEP